MEQIIFLFVSQVARLKRRNAQLEKKLKNRAERENERLVKSSDLYIVLTDSGTVQDAKMKG